MKNSYIIAGVILLIAILAFAFSNRSEAPIKDQATDQENVTTQNIALSSVEAGSYELNTEASTVTWKGEKVVGSNHEGTIKLKEGSFTMGANGEVSGEFTIDMNTIKSNENIERLENHLKDDDFFAVTKYPTGKFVIKSMTAISEEATKEGRYVFSGDLTLKGITKPISFTATLSSDEENNLYAKGTFAINRVDWDVKFGSSAFFSDLGDNVIRDAITIGLDLKGKKVIQ